MINKAVDWNSLNDRLEVLKDIYDSKEELCRKQESFAQYEIYNDRITPYVVNHLTEQLSAKTVKKMPIISSVNIAKKIVKSEASIYKTAPERTFSDITEEDQAAISAVYKDGKFNVKLKKANRYFKLQNQALIQVVPKSKKLLVRVLFPHNYDVIPNEENPEIADSYILSTFDRSQYIFSDGINQKIGDADDEKKLKDRFTVWSKEFNFVMNGKGEIVSGPETKNPIGILPFVDISADKDFEYFVRQGSTLTDFTVQYNAALSDLRQIERLQGYAQGIVSGPSNLIPEVLETGPNVLIHLPSDPQNPDAKVDFKFVTPTPNIDASLKSLENLLANFLSSRGVDTSTIQTSLNGGAAKKYSSGLERLLAMIDQFEASRDDIDLFLCAETEIFSISKAWLKYLSNSDLLDKKYSVSGAIDKVEVTTVYAKPENVQTDTDKAAYMQSRITMGISDKVDAIMYLDEVDEDEAIERLDEIAKRGMIQEPPKAEGDTSVKNTESQPV